MFDYILAEMVRRARIRFFIILAIAFFIGLVSTAAFADGDGDGQTITCLPRDEMAQALDDGLDAVRRWVGMITVENGELALFELYSSRDRSMFVIVITYASGESCVNAAGTGNEFMDITQPPNL